MQTNWYVSSSANNNIFMTALRRANTSQAELKTQLMQTDRAQTTTGKSILFPANCAHLKCCCSRYCCCGFPTSTTDVSPQIASVMGDGTVIGDPMSKGL
jgi:hypothetical protein